MGRRSKHKREELRVTSEWFKRFCEPRLTQRDKKLLRYVSQNRIVRSDQVARLFWSHTNYPQKQANRRLRVLYDLHCIDRFFPPVDKGSSKQHIVLDYAGARALELENFYKINDLPLTYYHTTLVAEFRLQAKLLGFSWGLTEEDLGPVKADIYYKRQGLAVEVDTGTETRETLKSKAQRYNRLQETSLIFVTDGARDRVDYILDRVHIPKAGGHFKNLKNFIKDIKRAR